MTPQESVTNVGQSITYRAGGSKVPQKTLPHLLNTENRKPDLLTRRQVRRKERKFVERHEAEMRVPLRDTTSRHKIISSQCGTLPFSAKNNALPMRETTSQTKKMPSRCGRGAKRVKKVPSRCGRRPRRQKKSAPDAGEG
jgi:hypothetical protein